MPNENGPSPNGYLVEFFQEFWDIINHDLLEVVKDSYSSKKMLKVLNSTFLTLISKREGANQLEFFRHIALCNVVYKLITKLIDERLKKWLPIIILEEQGDFITGRCILDGVVIAIEVVHSMASSRK